MARFEDQRASAQAPRRQSPKTTGGALASAVTGLMQEGIGALSRQSAVTPAQSAAAPRRGVIGRVFDMLATPLLGAAVGVIPSMMREARESRDARLAAGERSVKMSLDHTEAMAKIRAPKAQPPAASSASSSLVSSPAAEVELCDEKGCATGQFSHDAQGRPVVKFADGRVARCRLRRGKLTCPVDGRNMQGRVEH
jgi:hypothetical protein